MSVPKKDSFTTILKLKDPVKNIDDEPLKNFEKVKDKYKEGPNNQKIPKTMEELEKEAPDLTRGELLSGMLINGVKPESKEEAAMINRLARKIRNVTLKGKGDWEIDEETLGKLNTLIAKVPLDASSNMTVGDIQNMIEEALLDILSKKRQKE